MVRLPTLLDTILDGVTGALAWLVLPVSLLLFLQWPLRDLAIGYSREANDLAQWLFALYVAAALTFATRRDAHPRVTGPRHRTGLARMWRAGGSTCLLAWSGFVLVTGSAAILRSVIGLEAFPDTFNPGYFLVKAAAWLMAVLMACQAIRDLWPRAGS